MLLVLKLLDHFEVSFGNCWVFTRVAPVKFKVVLGVKSCRIDEEIGLISGRGPDSIEPLFLGETRVWKGFDEADKGTLKKVGVV